MMVKPATQDDRYSSRGMSNGLMDGDTRKAMTAAFDAMSDWRDEMAVVTEKQSAKVIDKMAAAAKAAGWPEAMVEATRSNMQQMTKMQLGMIDQVMDAWTEQMRSPNKLTFGNVFAKGMPGLGGAGPFGAGAGAGGTIPGLPQMDLAKYGFGTNPMAPLQFWIEASQAWQKQWADAVAAIMNTVPGAAFGSSTSEPPAPRKATSFR